MMNRRLAVRHLTLVAGAAALLPGCLSQSHDEQTASYPLKHLVLSARQEKLLAEVCETLIPRTATPGAKDLGLHLYVLKMLDDCTPPKDQQTFVAGLGQLDAAATRQLGQSFEASTAAQRTALLQRLDQQPAQFSEALGAFYRAARQLAIDGYTGSKYFMTKQVVYELVPGRYDGYFPVSKVNLAVPHHGQS
ncbi:gluconate 2-dehydrogenase subunit 3 family protein [Hymenobacter sp. BRD128]|uniref:gluconate 2-dehydrogenase subunit 3 family protein n=1 Tax=Hymenobacter sp. BRD128 TaxID=2675878 RepID=UPI0015643E2D|nr:gluconate 2-dehydrogenase subunit 3 family protein [Hymenobacter sp. BRD128]QKG56967.1 gluconate 2-dehydrogenase subunit 3 family protein [Hymenobacter sp. BRD128]